MKKLYDVTMPIKDNMIVYPGDRPVIFRRTQTIEKDGYNWSEISCGTHLGTHIDAPAHFISGGKTLDDFPKEFMVGMVEVVDIDSDMVDSPSLEKLTLSDWSSIFFRTRSRELWKLDRFSEDYVSLTPDAAEFLVKKKTRLVGIDYRSIEGFHAHDYPVHKILLGNGIFIIEGLCLDEVTQGRYRLYCLPLRLAAADGGPVRALLEPV